jgi:isopenicillin N synthase-like dioxygenase
MGSPLPDNTLDQPLPPPLAPHLDTLVSFQHHCHSLCQELFIHLATALQTPPDWFTSRHDQSEGPSGTVFRMLYYPASNDTDNTDLRAGAHSDFGSLTLLFQLPGQPGLEIKTPEGHWASVPVDPSNSDPGTSDKPLPILVNIGDLLEDVCFIPTSSYQRPRRKLTSRQTQVDSRPPQIDPSPSHLPCHANRVARPLLTRILLPPAG